MADNNEPEHRRLLREAAEHLRPESGDYVFIPELNEDDKVVLYLATTALRFRVVDPIYLDIQPEGLSFLGEHVKYHGAISLVDRSYRPMVVLPGFGVRLGMSADPIGAPERDSNIERSWVVTSEVYAASVNNVQKF
jgi:hypothetical protein